MSWLFHELAASLAAMAIFCAVYTQLYLTRRKRCLGAWSLAWAISFVRHGLLVWMPSVQGPTLLPVLNAALVIVAGYLLMAGSFFFVEEKAPRWPLWVFPPAFLWALAAGWGGAPLAVSTSPCSTALAAVYAITGLKIFSHKELEPCNRLITALVFLLWACLQMLYPFQETWGVSVKTGFILAAACQVLLGISVLALFFHRSSAKLVSTQAALSESQEKFSKAFHSSPVGMALIQLDNGRIIDISDSTTEITGYPPGEVVGKTSAELDFYVDPVQRDKVFGQIWEKGSFRAMELKIRHRSGRIIDAILSAETVGVGAKTCILASLMDITALKRAQADVDRLFQVSPDILAIADKKSILHRINPAVEEVLGYKPEDLMGCALADLVHPDDNRAVKIAVKRLVRSKLIEQIESRFRAKDGTYKWLSWNAIYVPEEGLAYGAGRDVTRQKQAADRLKLSLRQKELLLKEIHHRVKNNMQVVYSLLSLQENQIEDKNGKKILKESQKRVGAMALIHESLYRSDNQAWVGLGQYSAMLAENLIKTYQNGGREIGLSIDDQGVMIEVGQSVPCGLILNELISNAIKHAFVSGSAGELSIKARLVDQDVVFEVSDNGAGFPPGLDIGRSPTLGLSLVRGLAENQLNGSLEITSNKGRGACFRIRFPRGQANA